MVNFITKYVLGSECCPSDMHFLKKNGHFGIPFLPVYMTLQWILMKLRIFTRHNDLIFGVFFRLYFAKTKKK